MTKNKVAIITGASRGIGREVAIGLARDGYSVVLVARSKGDLKKVLDKINTEPVNGASAMHMMYAVDVADAQCIKKVVRDSIKKYGRIDVLINNAGAYFRGTSSVTIKELDYMLRVNLIAPFAFMREVIPIMKDQKDGYIINIASRAGKIGFSDEGAYAASKFGLVGLNESVYRELSTYGIRVTAICPGWTNTEMAQKGESPIAASEMIQPSDILKTIRWLLSVSPSVRIRELVMECKESIC
ncbi:MAG: SDR family oxidoreductase [Bacteroidota bacterium]